MGKWWNIVSGISYIVLGVILFLRYAHAHG